MPGMNGTGPYGTGPLGRGMGPCGGGGMGRRSGRGFGRNRGRGWAFEPVEEKTTLEREKSWLEAQLQAITEQLQALEKNNPGTSQHRPKERCCDAYSVPAALGSFSMITQAFIAIVLIWTRALG